MGYWGADAAQFSLSGTSVVFVRGIVLRDGPCRVSYHTQHLMGKKIVFSFTKPKIFTLIYMFTSDCDNRLEVPPLHLKRDVLTKLNRPKGAILNII